MKVLVIDTEKMQPQIVETPGGLKEWYRLIRCNRIDIAYRKIGGRYYDIIIDDEGLFSNDKAIPTGLNTDQEPCLVGNLVVCNYDGEGGEATLTDDDILHIKRNIVVLKSSDPESDKEWLAINNIAY